MVNAMQLAPSIPHNPLSPSMGGQDDDFAWFYDGKQYTICYRYEESCEFNGEAFVTHPDLDLGKAELTRRFPREAQP